MAGHCHNLVPDTMFNPMGALINVECRLDENAEGYTETSMPHNTVKLNRLKEFSDAFSPGVWVFSYHSMYSDIEKINEKFSIYERPCMIHEAGINDSYLNLDLENRCNGTRIGTGLFAAARKYITEMGLIHNVPLYYQNSCKWMRQIIKYTLEKARRCSNIQGYDFLGAIDCHWHRTGYAVGMLNEFYELKSSFTFEDALQFNGESVLSCNASTCRNFIAGGQFDIEFFVSLFGKNSLENGLLTWYLEDDWNNVYSKGQMNVSGIKNGEITDFGKITVEMPKISEAGKHFKLKARLYGGDYVLENNWDYWAFKDSEKSPEAMGCSHYLNVIKTNANIIKPLYMTSSLSNLQNTRRKP